eukprot:c1849_g1_i1.p1 GENE.c1849_g1_i1~~c1849_g1_i1.p1  ORF type:complete len:212 (-),score=98.30 c1849_g1_i1:35-631(-)
MKPLLPPLIKIQTESLYIKVHRAEGLPRMDLIGKHGIDAFVSVEYSGNKADTRIIQSRHPVWSQLISLSVNVPTMTNKIFLTVCDKDPIGFEVVGTATLQYSDLIIGKKTKQIKVPPVGANPFWVNLYGSDRSQDDSNFGKKMNRGFIEGTHFRGRLLITAWKRPNHVGDKLVQIFDVDLEDHRPQPALKTNENFVRF